MLLSLRLVRFLYSNSPFHRHCYVIFSLTSITALLTLTIPFPRLTSLPRIHNLLAFTFQRYLQSGTPPPFFPSAFLSVPFRYFISGYFFFADRNFTFHTDPSRYLFTHHPPPFINHFGGICMRCLTIGSLVCEMIWGADQNVVSFFELTPAFVMVVRLWKILNVVLIY